MASAQQAAPDTCNDTVETVKTICSQACDDDSAAAVVAMPCAPPAETAWEVLQCCAPYTYEVKKKEHSWLRQQLEKRMPHRTAAIAYTFRSSRKAVQFMRERPVVGLAVAAAAGASATYVTQAVASGTLLYLSLPNIVIHNSTCACSNSHSNKQPACEKSL